MPTYTYRCPSGHERTVTHGMTEDPVVRCDEDDAGEHGHCCGQWCCGPPACCCGPCDEPMHRAIVAAPRMILARDLPTTPNTRARGVDKADGYQAHLARFPNDPQAFTAGKNAKDRLIDQRLREGWREVASPRDQRLDGKPEHMRKAGSAIERAREKVRDGRTDFDE